MNWHKSSYSGGNGGDCVEVAEGEEVLVRDTQNRDKGHLNFSPNAWTALVKTLQNVEK